MINPRPIFEGLNVTFQVTEDCNLKCAYCLSSDTKITMFDFSEKKISDIKVGDKILGFNEYTNNIKFYETKVIQLFKRQSKVIELIFDNNNKLKITSNHKILYKTKYFGSSWKEVDKCKIGNKIYICSDKQKTATIKEINYLDEVIDVYNIGTESRTYIANGICVHNCYEVDKQPKDLPIDYAYKFIDILLADSDPIGVDTDLTYNIMRKGLVIDFIGGDALMRPDLCDKILSYYIFKSNLLNHKWANRWRTSISTNGTFFNNNDVRKFLLKYKGNIHIGVSVDGCPEIHNKNRSNSMDKLLEGWDWFLYYCSISGIDPGTKATLNKDSIPYLFKSLKFLHEEMKLQHISMNFIFEEMNLSDEDYKLLNNQLEMCVDYVLEHCDDLYWALFDKHFQIGCVLDKTTSDMGWCGAGSMPCVTVNGKIYPCFRFTPNTMHNRDFDMSVGDVWNGFNKKENFQLVRDQTREKLSCTNCLECPIESTCAWCIGGAYSQEGIFHRTTNLCKIKQIQDKWARVYWNKYNELKGIDERFEPIAYDKYDFLIK